MYCSLDSAGHRFYPSIHYQRLSMKGHSEGVQHLGTTFWGHWGKSFEKHLAIIDAALNKNDSNDSIQYYMSQCS